jgi:ABC-type transport system involved in cytochrome c biogenesis permease subunit
MTDIRRFVPWIILGLVALYLIVAMVPPSDPERGMRLREFARLPVLEGGRMKPIDTHARINLMQITNRQSYVDTDDKYQPAIKWMLDTMVDGLEGYYSILFIHDAETVEWLGLPPRRNGRYSLKEVADQFRSQLNKLDAITEKKAKDPEKLTPVENKVFQLAKQAAQRTGLLTKINKHQAKHSDPVKAKLYKIESDQVLAMLQLEPRTGLRYSLEEITGSKGFTRFLGRAKQLHDAARENKQLDETDTKVVALYRHLQIHYELAQLGEVLMVPDLSAPEEKWKTLGGALLQADQTGVDNPAARALETILLAYATDDVSEFNKAVAAYQAVIDEHLPSQRQTAGLEVWFNSFAPFYHCTVLMVLVILMVCLSWVCWRQELMQAAFLVAILSLVVQTLALAMRIYLQGRPPVTNLYSSAVFIGWGAVLLCLVLEVIYRNGLGSLVGAVVGFPTLLISHHLAAAGDTMEVLQAVLDTNFWLATHVVCVTIGYTATFVAGAFGIVYIIRGVFTTSLDKAATKVLGQMMYGVICFATLLSFVGTVLGGIWADQSWGRFWGWDPKENGAVLIVIMNALILHARWGGMVKERGMAVLTICGNIITMWSWFGTNQLGIGLHAYGFNKALVEMCRWFWVSQLMVLFLGCLPLKYWASSHIPEKLPAAPLPPAKQPRKAKKAKPGAIQVGTEVG